MKVICCYCIKDLGDKAPFEDTRISHGCCEECKNEQLAIIASLKPVHPIKRDYTVISAS